MIVSIPSTVLENLLCPSPALRIRESKRLYLDLNSLVKATIDLKDARSQVIKSTFFFVSASISLAAASHFLEFLQAITKD